MVTPRDAERIALAQAEGQIMLVLRNPLDTDTTLTAGIKTDSLMGSEPAPAATATAAPVVRAQAPRRAAMPSPARRHHSRAAGATGRRSDSRREAH